MNKEYVLEKLAQASVSEYTNSREDNLYQRWRGRRSRVKKEKSNVNVLIDAHRQYMEDTGKPVTLMEFKRLIEKGEVNNPFEPSMFKKFGKKGLLLGGAALAGVVGYNMLQSKNQTPMNEPELPQIYNTTGGQLPYGQ